MKRMRWIIICLMVLCLMGCAAAEPETEPSEKENWQMSENLIQMIVDAAGCSDSRAEAILETFQEIGMAEPASARSAEKNDNSIIVETASGEEYEVGLNKKHFVFSIKDLTTGKYVYMVYE